MKHRVAGKRLSRDTAHRKALIRNLSTSLIHHGSVETTLAKAKFVTPFIEKLVTEAKSGGFSTVKQVRKKLVNESAIENLFKEVAPKFSSRKGGYTRIVKLGTRKGDNASMARIEWAEEKRGETK